MARTRLNLKPFYRAAMTNNPSFANLNPPMAEINLLCKAVANAGVTQSKRARIPPQPAVGRT